MLDTYQHEIALALEEGFELSDVERQLIEPARELSDDERAALWLYAWSCARRQRQSLRPAELLA